MICPCCQQDWTPPEAHLYGDTLFLNGIPQDLHPLELNIFLRLRASLGSVVPNAKLMDFLPRSKDPKALMVHISHLRGKLTVDLFKITSVKGGYMMELA
jgi:DNA-binding response OmpR family regulator